MYNTEPLKEKEEVELRDFIFERCIGKGGTADVYLGRAGWL